MHDIALDCIQKVKRLDKLEISFTRMNTFNILKVKPELYQHKETPSV